MPLTLREKQSAFAVLVARLILEAQRLGYQLTFGEAYRSPEEADRLAHAHLGIARSLHTDRLAIDFNLFVDGVYQAQTSAYGELGAWWEAQSTDELICAWGGRFARADGNHFAIAHNGRR
jgi:hypothetical protein